MLSNEKASCGQQVCAKRHIPNVPLVSTYLAIHPLFFQSLIFLCDAWCVCPALLPSSLFALITSTEACTTCPLRPWRRGIDAQTEGRGWRKASFSVEEPFSCLMTELQHLPCDDRQTNMHTYLVTFVFMCVFSVWGNHTSASSTGLLWEQRGFWRCKVTL